MNQKCLNILYDTDLFKLKTHVLIQGCNCFNTMGAGIAKIIKDKYPEVYNVDLKTKKGDINKLGNFSYSKVNDPNILYIVNLYSQYTYYDKNNMFSIKAFEKGMNKIIDHFIEKRNLKNKKNIPILFSFPAIGLGLANGKIEEIYNSLLKIEKKYKNSNISLNLCLHPKDKELQEKFKKIIKKVENEKNIINNINI